MNMNEYLAMFIDESNDHLQSLNENLLRLENTPDDLTIVQSIFRSAHTLKGMSATMGFEDLAALTHQMENVLDLVRNRKLEMSSIIFDTMFKGLDALENMVQDVIKGGTGSLDVTSLVQSLEAIVQDQNVNPESNVATETVVAETVSEDLKSVVDTLDQFQSSIIVQSIESGLRVYYVDVKLKDDCVLRAARAYMVFDFFENSGEVIKATPTVQDIEQEKFDRTFSVFLVTKHSPEQIQAGVLNVSETELATVSEIGRVFLEQLNVKSEGQAAPVVQEVDKVVEQQTVQVNEAKEESKPVAGQITNVPRTIRVDLERLDSLMNLFSELIIDRVRLEQLASEVRRNDLTETVEHMARVSSDLQNIVLKLRMVPVESVFNRFPRMIRDIAKTLDKKIDLVISGAETELDRTVIDEIGDPLVHLLRNSCDHGIESVSARLAAGKPETGTIKLRAFHSGNHVFIEIEDDGAGINREKVVQKAISKGIVSQDRARQLTDNEIDMLLFAPGFSTADKISDISGRGVGLDVVKTKIASLGGHVSVTSEFGKGSVFSIQLPLTLSIISAMLVKLGNEKYAIPLNSIVETGIAKRNQFKSVQRNYMFEFRGSVIPVISLSGVLESPSYSERDEDETEIIIIRKGDKLAAITVDEFIGQSDIVLKSLGSYLSDIDLISGATILGDGQVALIIDPNSLIV